MESHHKLPNMTVVDKTRYVHPSSDVVCLCSSSWNAVHVTSCRCCLCLLSVDALLLRVCLCSSGLLTRSLNVGALFGVHRAWMLFVLVRIVWKLRSPNVNWICLLLSSYAKVRCLFAPHRTWRKMLVIRDRARSWVFVQNGNDGFTDSCVPFSGASPVLIARVQLFLLWWCDASLPPGGNDRLICPSRV